MPIPHRWYTSGTANGIKALQLLQPGYTQDQMFSNPFLSQLKRFSVLRFMDWGRTTGSPVTSWAGRALLTDAQWTLDKGVPLEAIFELGNTLSMDVWVCIPHAAGDEYATSLGQLIKSHPLKAGLSVFIEYSNEVWNWQFPQAQYNLQQAKVEVAGNPESPLNYDNTSNVYYWGYRRVALRLYQLSNAIRKVVGADVALRPVLAGQVGGVQIQLGLDMIAAVFGPPSSFLSAIAIAPYFSLGPDRGKPGLTEAQVLADLKNQSMAQVPEHSGPSALREAATLAAWYGLELRGYEGGPDTFGPDNIPAKKAANLDAAFEPIAASYLNNWLALGAGPLNWFTAGAGSYGSQYGDWPLTDCMRNQDTPKIRAIDRVLAMGTVPVTVGHPVTKGSVVNATETVPRQLPGHGCAFGPVLCGFDSGEY
eukprot:gene1578-2833_t